MRRESQHRQSDGAVGSHGRSAACRSLICAVVVTLLVAAPAFGSGTGVITTKADEFDPAASGAYLVWTVATKTHHFVVYARPAGGGSKFRVNAAGTEGRVGGIDTDGKTLIYQQYVPDKNRSDIYAYDLATKQRTKIGKPVSTGTMSMVARDPVAGSSSLASSRGPGSSSCTTPRRTIYGTSLPSQATPTSFNRARLQATTQSGERSSGKRITTRLATSSCTTSRQAPLRGSRIRTPGVRRPRR